MTSTVQIVLTSAGVAALISAGATFLNAHLERKARRRELALSKALDIATEWLRIKAKGEGAAHIGLITQTAHNYFRFFECLVEGRKIPDEVKAAVSLY